MASENLDFLEHEREIDKARRIAQNGWDHSPRELRRAARHLRQTGEFCDRLDADFAESLATRREGHDPFKIAIDIAMVLVVAAMMALALLAFFNAFERAEAAAALTPDQAVALIEAAR